MASDNFLWFLDPAVGGNLPNKSALPAGETTDKFFSGKKAIEISAFGFGVAQADSASSSTTGMGAGKVKFDEFSVTKAVDTASNLLYQACAAGAHFPTVYLAMRKAGGGPIIYLEYIFRMVFVTGITWSGGSGDEPPSEEVKFKFGAMGMQYTQQDSKGQAGTPKQAMWSVVANAPNLTAPPSLTDTPPFDKPDISGK